MITKLICECCVKEFDVKDLNWIDRGDYRSLACTKCITKFDLKFDAKYKTNSKKD